MIKENTAQNILRNENIREKEVLNQVVEMAKPILEKSHLLNNKFLIDNDDVKIVEQVIQTIFPVDSKNCLTHAHLQLTAKFGAIFAQKLGLNPNEIKILMLAHDDGRFITNRWLRNEILAGSIFKKLGIRKDLMEKATPISWDIPEEISPQSVENYLNSLSDEQKVVIMADICGKRKFDDWGILPFDKVMDYHNQQRGKEKQNSLENRSSSFPSERAISDKLIGFYGEVYKGIKDWFGQKGVDVEEIRKNILEEEKNSPVETIIFDVGNVLVPNPDPLIIDNFANECDLDPEIVKQALASEVKPFQTGNINEEKFWKNFEEKLGKSLPQDYKKMILSGLSEKIKPEMIELLDSLKKKQYKLAILTDTIPPHRDYLQKEDFVDYFNTYMTSIDFKVTKDDPVAFACVLAKLGVSPSSCVFIDDKTVYLENANKLGIKTINYKITDPIADLENNLKEKGIKISSVQN